VRIEWKMTVFGKQNVSVLTMFIVVKNTARRHKVIVSQPAHVSKQRYLFREQRKVNGKCILLSYIKAVV